VQRARNLLILRLVSYISGNVGQLEFREPRVVWVENVTWRRELDGTAGTGRRAPPAAHRARLSDGASSFGGGARASIRGP
jgi:hypothetical protein